MALPASRHRQRAIRSSLPTRGSATTGALYTGLSQAVHFVVQLTSVVLLSRLLHPDQIGLMAMMTPVVVFLIRFGDLGLTQATVTAGRISSRQTSTLFWVNLALAAALFAMICAIAPLVGRFYGEPLVVLPLVVLGSSILLSAAGAQHKALMTRTLRFKSIAIVDVVAVLGGFVASVGSALVEPTVGALIAGTLATAFLSSAGFWLLSGWRPRFRLGLRASLGLLRFGRNLLGFNLLNFLSRNADNVLVGRYSGAEALGYYDRAYRLMLFPLGQFNGPIGRVIVPVLSRLVDEPERYRRAYLGAVGQLLLLTIPGVAFMISNAATLIPALLGPRWQASVPIFLWLGLAAVHQPLSATTGWLFISQSRTREFAQWGLVIAVTSILAFILGLPWGAVGVAAAYGLSDLLIRAPIVWYWIGRKGPVSTRDLVRLGLPHGSGLAAVLLIAWKFGMPRLAASELVNLAAAAVLAYLVAWSFVALWPSGRSTLQDLRETAMILVRKIRPGS
jgi:polysaccharide transporter, PST family